MSSPFERMSAAIERNDVVAARELLSEGFVPKPEWHVYLVLMRKGELHELFLEMGVYKRLPYIPTSCPKAVQRFVELGVDINALNKDGRTPLMEYFVDLSYDRRGDDEEVQVIEELISLGADVSVRNSRGNAAIDCTDVHQWILLAHGSPPPRQASDNLLWYAGKHDLQLRRAATYDAAIDMFDGYLPEIADLIGRFIHEGPEHEIHIMKRQLKKFGL